LFGSVLVVFGARTPSRSLELAGDVWLVWPLPLPITNALLINFIDSLCSHTPCWLAKAFGGGAGGELLLDPIGTMSVRPSVPGWLEMLHRNIDLDIGYLRFHNENCCIAAFLLLSPLTATFLNFFEDIEMTTPTEQFAEFNDVLTSAVRSAEIAVTGIERLANLQFASAKSTIEEAASKAKALGQAKDLQEFTALYSNVASTAVETGVAYARKAYDLAAATQSELTAVVTDNLTALNQALVSAVEKAAKSAPVSGELIVAAVKSQIATTTAAADSITKAAKQVTELAEARVKSVADATTAAVKSTKVKKAA
jgi:phasin family protein